MAASAATDRWSALSAIESGNRDRAIGPAGEVSRYQILPHVWRRSLGSARVSRAQVGVSPTDPRVALVIARRIMSSRLAHFRDRFRRLPTDFEFYVLWNAPAQIDRPSRAVAGRAQRFCNLITAP
ncbi:MAG: hypothetical protein ACYDH9_08060 [Limisphaerales bacterium]